MRALQRRHVVAAVVVLAAAIGSLGGLMHSMAEAAPDSLPGNCHPSFGELPDICPSLPTDQIDGGRAPYLEILSDGTRRYRFDAVLWNAGGAFELEGRECDSFVCDRLGQRIYLGDGEPGTGGGSELRDIPGRLIFEVGDGHNHFHFENAARYEIVVPNGENIVSSKVGFCMFDTYPDPNAHPPRKWYSANCPRQGSHVEMGIARGWGDYYTAALTFQWIVVTLLEPGAYTMRAEVDPGREFLEANYANNVLETPREIPGATAASATLTTLPDTPLTVTLSGTVEGKAVEVRDRGRVSHNAADHLDFAITSEPEHGTLSTLATTSDTTAELVYTPDPGYAGPDSFTYRTTDSRGLDSLTATITLDVNHPPPPPPPPVVEPPAEELPPPPPKRTRRLKVAGTAAAEIIRGTGAAEIINAGAGNDTIRAGGGRDVVRGGRGNDRIFGGSGRDVLAGGRGNDVIRARDGKRDTVNCGRGKKDRAVVDVIDLVSVNCEIILLP